MNPRIETRYPLYRRLGGPQGQLGRAWKFSPPPGLDLRTIQPVASRYNFYVNICFICNTDFLLFLFLFCFLRSYFLFLFHFCLHISLSLLNSFFLFHSIVDCSFFVLFFLLFHYFTFSPLSLLSFHSFFHSFLHSFFPSSCKYLRIFQSFLAQLDINVITVAPSFRLSAVHLVSNWRDVHVLIPDTEHSVSSI